MPRSNRKDDPDRCDKRTMHGPVYYPQCKNRWVVRVTQRNGEVSYLCRVHLRPLVRQGLAVEITSATSR